MLSLDDTVHSTPSERLPYLLLPYHESMKEHTRTLIFHALREESGNQTKAAARLGLQRTYLARLIKQYDIASDQNMTS